MKKEDKQLASDEYQTQTDLVKMRLKLENLSQTVVELERRLRRLEARSCLMR